MVSLSTFIEDCELKPYLLDVARHDSQMSRYLTKQRQIMSCVVVRLKDRPFHAKCTFGRYTNKNSMMF